MPLQCPPRLACHALPFLIVVAGCGSDALVADGRAARQEAHRLASPQLGGERELVVWLPPDYDHSDRRYPVLLVNDGAEALSQGHLDEVAAATFMAGEASPALLVFVAADLARRADEYSCEPSSRGPLYTSFLCDKLVPWLDRTYRTRATADDRGIIGASMGGLISFAALFWRNDCLRRAGGQSGAYWVGGEMMPGRVRATDPPVNVVRAYLDNGAPDDNSRFVHDMRDALQERGYPVYHWENPVQEHTWAAWASRFDEALGALFPP